jgi:Zn-dependent protease
MFLEYLIMTPILLFTLTIHEVSHGYVAYLLGDDTAKRAGRLTLNPIKHLDIVGLLMLFIIKIGWAKPVPINPYNFKDFKRDTALTAAAGPVANFILAIIFSIFFRIVLHYSGNIFVANHSVMFKFLKKIFYLTIFYNTALGLFNLIPFPPLDGSKILGGFLSDDLYFTYTGQERNGMMIFMVLMGASYIFKLNIVGSIIMPPLNFLMHLLTGINI